MARAVKMLATGAALLAAAVAPAQVHTYTEAELEYPVPLPVDSQTPVTGFRSYTALTARLAALLLDNPAITVQTSGSSFQGRPIRSYRFSNPGSTDSEGIAKSAAFIQGTIHAREWASPEVTMAIFEWLALEGTSDPLATYLLDATETVIHPLANPDAFLQTQRFPAQVYRSGADYDGRNRRKNMRASGNTPVDESLATTGDMRLGVDLNRNRPKGWSSASAGATSETYRGTAAGSEPETQAAYAAETMLLQPARLRVMLDIHSAIPAYYRNYDSSTTRNAAVTKGADLMAAAVAAETGLRMGMLDVEVEPVSGISGDTPAGATDEYFTDKYRCMAYTVELRTPQVGFGVNDFVLPASEVPDLRRENLTATKAMLYYASGPAAVVDISFYTSGGDTLVWRQQRLFGSGTRTAAVAPVGALVPGGSYLVAVRFNKPMRRFTASGSAALLPGMAGAVAPTLQLQGLGSAAFLRWSRAGEAPATAPRRYEGDTAVLRLDVPLGAAASTYTLAISAVDLVGVPIDANPATVADWTAQGWVRIEGGSDLAASVPLAAPSGVPEGWTVR